MSEKKALTDEQLERVGGGVVTLTHDGVTVTFGGPETWLAFSEMERECGFTGYKGDTISYTHPVRGQCSYNETDILWKETEYHNWYYDYYGEPHPDDRR